MHITFPPLGPTHPPQPPCSHYVRLAGEIKLGRRLSLLKHTPELLDIFLNLSVLIRLSLNLCRLLEALVKHLEHEHVDAPLEEAADGVLPVDGRALDGRDGVLEGGTVGGPVGLADPELEVFVALDLLDVVETSGKMKVSGGRFGG